MTYSQAIELLRAVAENIAPNGTFVFGKKADASLISQTTAFPLIWLAPFREQIDRIKGNVSRSIVLVFLYQDTTNYTEDQRQTLIQNAWQLKETYMTALNATLPKVAAYIGEISTPEFMQLSGSATGYSVQFTMQSKLPC
jgi:hypothetical protein